MITSGTSTYLFRDGTVFIVSAVPGRCACGRMSFLFKNENGKTFCLGCESSRLMVAPSECDVADDGPDPNRQPQPLVLLPSRKRSVKHNRL